MSTHEGDPATVTDGRAGPHDGDDEMTAGTGNTVLGDAWVNCKRWTRKSVRNPSVLVLELSLAAFSLLMFSSVFGDVGHLALARNGFGDVGYVTFILPAVVAQVAMGSALSSGMGLVGDLESGMFEKTVVTPMSWTAVFAGKVTAELTRIAVHVLVILGLGVAMGATIETGIVGVVGVVLVAMLFSLWFLSLSNVLALVTRNEESLDAAGNLLLFPLLFLSSGFLPVASLPDWVRTFATYNPVTYGVDAMRALVLGEDVLTALEVSGFGGVYDTLVPALAVLVVLNLAAGALAVWLLSKASSAGAE